MTRERDARAHDRRLPIAHNECYAAFLVSLQTGIYPAVIPGGWNIIGRTRKKPYDPGRPVPFLFGVGDEVRFRAVSRAEFEQQDTE